MVPEDLSEGAALSAPEATGEEPASAAAEVAEGTSDVAEAAAPLSSWADLSEEATAPTTDQPGDLIDLGVEPPTTAFQSGEGAGFGAPADISDTEDLPRFDALSLLTTEVKEETEHVTAEQILRELEDLAPEFADDAEHCLEETGPELEAEASEVVDDPESNTAAEETTI